MQLMLDSDITTNGFVQNDTGGFIQSCFVFKKCVSHHFVDAYFVKIMFFKTLQNMKIIIQNSDFQI